MRNEDLNRNFPRQFDDPPSDNIAVLRLWSGGEIERER